MYDVVFFSFFLSPPSHTPTLIEAKAEAEQKKKFLEHYKIHKNFVAEKKMVVSHFFPLLLFFSFSQRGFRVGKSEIENIFCVSHIVCCFGGRRTSYDRTSRIRKTKKLNTKANLLVISFAGSAEGALAVATGEAPKNYIKNYTNKK